MEQHPKNPTRSKFILWTAAVLSSFTVLKLISGSKKKKNAQPEETVRMLGQDGKLVEIDKSLLASSRGKVSNEELQKWIKK